MEIKYITCGFQVLRPRVPGSTFLSITGVGHAHLSEIRKNFETTVELVAFG